MENKKTKLEIKYKDFIDENNSETIVILHGWGGSSESWVDVGDLLNESGFNVLIPDLPGFGKTKLNYEFDLNEYAKVITNFLRELNIDNFILWGHSNGGSIAIKIANSNIFNIKRLVLNSSAGIRNDKKRSLRRRFYYRVVKIFSFLKNIRGFKKIRNLFYRAIGAQDYLNSEKIPYLKETFLNVIKEDLRDEIKNINIDTLLIWGDNDSYTPLSDAYFMRENIPKSKLVILEDETHGIHLNNPIRLVETFLNNI